MLSGELTFNEHMNIDNDDKTPKPTHFPFWGGLLFTIFMMMMSVVVVNLLFGLAVNETQVILTY